MHVPPERAKSAQASPAAPASVRQTLARPGRPLESDVRRELQTWVGRDLSGVRIHDGAEADTSARELHAAAYTVGSSVVFGHGRYLPHTPAGRRLLVHELVHVVQQREAASILPTVGQPHDASELAAERVAARVSPRPSLAAGLPPAPSVATAVPAIQRQGPAPTGLPDKPSGDRATDAEIETKLTEFLARVLTAQGGQTLKDSPVIAQALRTLAQGNISAVLTIDAFLAQKFHPSSPTEYAKAARAHLPQGISKAQLATLDKIPSAPSASAAPTSVGDALGRLVVDQTIAPLIRKLHVSKATQAKLIEAARAAVASGVAAAASAAISAASLDPQAQASLSAAIEAAIKQTRKPQPAGSDMPTLPPPTTAPPQPPPTTAPPLPPVPGAVNLPKIPIPDTPDARRRPTPVTPTPAAVEQVIQGLDDNALTPPDARGKPLADSLSGAQDFARALADRLDAAQRAKNYTVEMTISSAYRQVADMPAVLDEVERIVRLVAGAVLPQQGSSVGQVIVTVVDTHILRKVRLQ
jgi:hypothetical protein